MRKLTGHIIYWIVVYFLWIYLKSYGNPEKADFVINVANVSIFILVYYSLKNTQIPKLFNKGRIVLFFLSLLLSSTLFLGLWVLLMMIANFILGEYHEPHNTSLGGYLIETIQFYSPSLALLAWELYNERRKELQRIQALKKETMLHELKYIKARMNPDFLLNALHSLHEKVKHKKPEASEMILKLSGILDYVLYKSQNEYIELSDEVTIIEDYLKLEENRFERQFSSQLNAPDVIQFRISPLVLLSFVQHVIKGMNKEEEQDLIIDIIVEREVLKCNILSNRIMKVDLSQYQMQLQHLYPDAHSIDIDQADAKIISLTINIHNE